MGYRIFRIGRNFRVLSWAVPQDARVHHEALWLVSAG
jgi:hypothetical protein